MAQWLLPLDQIGVDFTLCLSGQLVGIAHNPDLRFRIVLTFNSLFTAKLTMFFCTTNPTKLINIKIEYYCFMTLHKNPIFMAEEFR